MPDSSSYESLNGRVVFITGGATGIGAAMVRAFVSQKAKVAFVDIDKRSAHELVATLEKEFASDVWFAEVDVTDPELLQKAILDSSEFFGGLEVLINNVANDMRHKTENVTVSDWHECMQVNLDPAFFASQTALAIMRKQHSGSIINLSSINALISPSNMTGYVTAKAGLIGMTKAFARDFGKHNIRVNAILPGWVATQKQLDNWLTKEEEDIWMKSVALKKRIKPSDIANLALFLASSNSALITGQSITVDGGRT